MRRDARDTILFTRRKNGIPAPALDLCMTRYRNMFIMNMPSKILDNIYLFMNMPAWTNEKSFWSE
jgi:hypothetical protein